MARKGWLILALAVLLPAGGVGEARDRPRSVTAAAAPIAKSHNTAQISVLTYNIEGLAWPIRSNRGAKLRAISQTLASLARQGRGPDIALFQEAFSRTAKRAVSSSGYDTLVWGPRRTTRSDIAFVDPLPGNRRAKRGELGIHLVGSGIVIASRFEVTDSRSLAYGSGACAGIDCLSNKGIVFARITVPGVPRPIDIYNTHMNSMGASRAPLQRHSAAHDRQALAASRFIDQTHDDANPLVFGGDFNMRHSAVRWANFSRYQALNLVHQSCIDPASGCDVRMSWDGDAPWMDTQDLQFFASGDAISIRPIRVEAMFDGSPGSPALSDHDGLLVTYEISWPARPTDR